MKDEQKIEEQTKLVLEALDEAIAQGPWEDSNFLRTIEKNLKQIRANFVAQFEQNAPQPPPPKKTFQRTDDLQEVFISLYSSDGSFLTNWERILANLPRQIISRPIYKEEADVRHLLKSKENRINEAYISLFIKQQDILALTPEKVGRDKFGKPLINLKDRTINLENVTRFVHVSGVYEYANGRLHKTATPSEL